MRVEIIETTSKSDLENRLNYNILKLYKDDEIQDIKFCLPTSCGFADIRHYYAVVILKN